MRETKTKGKLPEAVIKDARYQYWIRCRPLAEIAEYYDLPRTTAHSIVQYENYALVEDNFRPEQIRRAV